jgi:molybdopterin synthase catalytic subunit
MLPGSSGIAGEIVRNTAEAPETVAAFKDALTKRRIEFVRAWMVHRTGKVRAGRFMIFSVEDLDVC